MSLNMRIRTLRAKLGLTQTDFGAKVGLKQNTVGQIENGQRGVTDRTILLLCQTYNVNEEWLRTGNGEMFLHTASTAIEQLARDYDLDKIDRAIINGYLELSTLHRKVIKQYITNLAASLGTESYQVPAAGNSAARVELSASDKKELRKIKENLLDTDDSYLLE